MTLKTIYFLITCAPLVCCLLCLLAARKNLRLLESHCSSPVPTLQQSNALTAFQNQINNYKKAIAGCGFLASCCIVATIFCLLIVLEASFTVRLAIFGVVAIFTLARITTGDRIKQRLEGIFAERPELQRFETFAKLEKLRLHTPYAPSNCPRGSMDQPALILETNMAAAAPLSHAEAVMLSKAHQDSLHDTTLSIGEPMLVIFKGKNKQVKAFVAACDLVWPTVEESSEDGIVTGTAGRVYISEYNFSGAKIGHIDRVAFPQDSEKASLKNDFLTHGWIATKDRAHILLSLLTWLSDDDRALLYELINPGRPFPQDWLETAVSRGSWQDAERS